MNTTLFFRRRHCTQVIKFDKVTSKSEQLELKFRFIWLNTFLSNHPLLLCTCIHYCFETISLGHHVDAASQDDISLQLYRNTLHILITRRLLSYGEAHYSAGTGLHSFYRIHGETTGNQYVQFKWFVQPYFLLRRDNDYEKGTGRQGFRMSVFQTLDLLKWCRDLWVFGTPFCHSTLASSFPPETVP